jgi:hypothetical protein
MFGGGALSLCRPRESLGFILVLVVVVLVLEKLFFPSIY